MIKSCQACLGVRRGFHHALACKARQREWQERRESEEETQITRQEPFGHRRNRQPRRRVRHILRRKHLEATHYDDDFFTRRDQNAYHRIEIVDAWTAKRMIKTDPRPPEEHDVEDDIKEKEVDNLDTVEVLKLARNEGLDPAAVERRTRKK